MNARRWTILAALVLTVLASLVWWRIEATFDAMLAIGRRIEREYDASRGSRPVLFGAAEEGAAFDCYLAANDAVTLAGVAGATDEAGNGFPEWLQQPATIGTEARAILARLSPAIALVRQGSHRRVGRQAIEWGGGISGQMPDMLAHLQLTQGILTTAGIKLREGEHREGVGLLLDVMQFSRDMMDDPVAITSMVGAVGLMSGTQLFFRDELDGKPVAAAVEIGDLSKDALELLASGLARLDRPLPPHADCLRCEAALLVREIRARGTSLGGPINGKTMVAGWRYAFSTKWMLAQAVLDMDEIAGQFPAETAPWSEWRAHFAELRARRLHEINPVHRIVESNFEVIAAGRRRGLVAIRALRALVAEARGAGGELRDPFGGSLRVGQIDGRTAWWSVGPDGVDDDGDGEKDVRWVR